MNSECQKPAHGQWRWIRPIVKRMLPRGVREKYLDALDALDALHAQQEPPARMALAAASTIAAGFVEQALASFNMYCFLAEMVLVFFSFGASSWSLPPGLVIAEGAVLGALTLQRTYFRERQNFERYEDYQAGMPAISQYYLDSVESAATVAVFLLASQVLVLRVSPASALPVPILARGTMVCLPLIPVIQMVLRPTPDPKAPFKGPGLSAKAVFNRIWVLNALWMLSVYGLIVLDVTDDPHSIMDPLRGGLPLIWFVVWTLLQRVALNRRDHLLTIFTDWRRQELTRKVEMLPQGLAKDDPFFRLSTGLEILGLGMLAASLIAGLQPWLDHQSGDMSMLQPASRILAFAVPMLSWKYVKQANRAAARSLQEEIKVRKTQEAQRGQAATRNTSREIREQSRG